MRHIAGISPTKSQSAMEYLMTYGWAILAIAIVMVSLYSLGIFNLGGLAPTAIPGSCQVIRTAAEVGLAGQCNNLIPKYVSKFGGSTTQYINVTQKSFKINTYATISAWIYPVGLAGSTWYTVTDNIWGVQHGGWQIILQPTLMRCSPSNSTGYDPAQVTTTFSNNTWYFIVCRFNNTKIMEYKNNNLVGSMSITHTIQNPTQNTFIGSSDNLGNPTSTFSGYIANLQIYNTSLDNASITSLYREGIGGSPIDLQHLVAWWPLNGNANDYSGYNNNGNATKAVAWSANWQPGYTAPST